MRIAFVGKGGSGKTTLTALFTQRISKEQVPVLAIDADLNMHLAELIGLKNNDALHLSAPSNEKAIKHYLKGKNDRIKELTHFRKTTPPSTDSNFLKLGNLDDYLIKNFALSRDNLHLMVVGTYQDDGIGTSCYHNNLAIVESMLSHTLDETGVVVMDMVAGIDAFANTLHAQFDLLVLVVEPTKRSLEVLQQYQELAKAAGTFDVLRVIGNKVRSDQDRHFLQQQIQSDLLLGFFEESDYLRAADQEDGALEFDLLEPQNQQLIESVKDTLSSIKPSRQQRLQKLHELHKAYVGQASIRERFGDLADQIDSNFSYERMVAEHGS